MLAFISVSTTFMLLGSLFPTETAGQSANASVVRDNPIGKLATATLPQRPFWQTGGLDGNVQGSLTVQSNDDGVGVIYTVSFSNLPTSGGPFSYHIHQTSVPDGCNCTATLAHLDPTGRGENHPCDSTHPATCQVGDLSGKYGAISSDPFTARYHDLFSSMNVGSDASIPDRSVVVHFANKTRITCANFVVDLCTENSTMPAPDPPADPTADQTLDPSPSNITNPGAPTPTFIVVTGAANALDVGRLSRGFVATLLFIWV